MVGFGILPYPVFPGLFYNIIIILITTPLTDDLPLKSINVQTLTVIARIVGFEYKNCLIVNCWYNLFLFGIIKLHNEDWQRGKCGKRWSKYGEGLLAAGLPPLFNIYIYKQISNLSTLRLCGISEKDRRP